MPMPEIPDLTIVSTTFSEDHVTIEYFEDTDVHERTMMRHIVSVPVEDVEDEAQEAYQTLRDLWSAMLVAHRDPPKRLPR